MTKSVHTMPSEDGRWHDVTEGAQSYVMSFNSLAEAPAVRRAWAKRLRCVRIIQVSTAPYDRNASR